MAKTSKIVADERRRRTVARHARRRAELKETIRTAADPQVRDEAYRALRRLPRDASPTRLRNRGVKDGRPRGYLGRFGLSRVTFREMAHRGELPGVTKSSW